MNYGKILSFLSVHVILLMSISCDKDILFVVFPYLLNNSGNYCYRFL